MAKATRTRALACRTAALGTLLLGAGAAWASAAWAPAHAAIPQPTGAPFPADAPIQLERVGQITDKVNALGGRRGEVAAALTQLDTQHGIQLFVAYVRDFSGRAPADWANETAAKSGLGLHDVLLAVATHARQYGYSTDTDSGVTAAQMASVATAAVEPALRLNDWAGAAIGAAQGIGAVVSGLPIPAVAVTPGVPDPGDSSTGVSGAALAGTVVVVGGLGAAGVWAYSRTRRRRRRRRTAPAARRRSSSWTPPPNTRLSPPTTPSAPARRNSASPPPSSATRPPRSSPTRWPTPKPSSPPPSGSGRRSTTRSPRTSPPGVGC
ncbi:TPM domain-containing protein [Catenulispora yoronensis]